MRLTLQAREHAHVCTLVSQLGRVADPGRRLACMHARTDACRHTHTHTCRLLITGSHPFPQVKRLSVTEAPQLLATGSIKANATDRIVYVERSLHVTTALG